MPKHIKILYSLLFLLVTNYTAQARLNMLDTFKIRGANNELISNYYAYFEDKKDVATVNEIIQQLKQGGFNNGNKGKWVFNSKYTRSSYWFALALKNDTTYTLPLLWSFYENNLDYVLYDITDNNHPLFIDSVLSFHPLSQRKFPIRSPTFKIDLPAKTYKLLLVKVYLLNADGIYFPSDLTTTEDVLLWETNYSFLLGRYIGYFIFICVFNLFLWILLKVKIHIWHSIYIFMLILYSLSENMFDVLCLPDWLYPTFNKLPKMLFLAFAMGFSMIVFEVFSKQKLSSPRFNSVFSYFKRINFTIAVLLFFGSLLFPYRSIFLSVLRIIIDLLFFIGLFITSAYILYGILKKDKLVLAFFIASLFLIVAYLDFAIANIFNLQLFYIRPGNILIGLAIEVTLLTAFFIININNERKKSYLALTQKSEENIILTQNIITTQEQERKRIAEDLHDDIGATLSALHLHISNIPEYILSASPELQKFYAQSLSLASKAATDVRGISHDLLPKDFAELGLFAVLQNRMYELNAANAIQFTFIADGDEKKLDNIYSVTIYRIINELISNIIKHSQAQKALVQILINETETQTIAEDNGIGIRTEKIKNGIGMKNIQSRVDFLKGTLNMDSSEKGTTIIINVPMNK